jgi:hypothetical protein
MIDGRDSGSIELGVLLILLFVAAILSCLSYYGASSMLHIKRNHEAMQSRSEAIAIVRSIVLDMQVLAHEPIDYPGNPSVLDLESKYSANALRLTDASSGYHLDCIPDYLLQSASIRSFFFIDASSAVYETHRTRNGPVTNEIQLTAFVRPEAMPFCTIYGWINGRERPVFACKTIERNFRINDAKNAFPLVNNLAMMNINMMDPAALIPLLRAGSWGIKNIDKAEARLLSIARAGPVGDAELVVALGVPAKCRIFAYLGGKTSFWRLILTHKGHAIHAIVAGIPEEDEESRRVGEYRLIDWEMRDAP